MVARFAAIFRCDVPKYRSNNAMRGFSGRERICRRARRAQSGRDRPGRRLRRMVYSEIFHEGISDIGAVVVGDAGGRAFHILHQAVEVVA